MKLWLRTDYAIRMWLNLLYNLIIGMTTKRQFSQTYEEVVGLVRQLKNSNDKLNKSIGVQSDRTIISQIRAQQSLHDDITSKVNGLIAKLEISYLDPDTARRIGTVKQQYRIQKDRRQHLLQSVEMQQKQFAPYKSQANERRQHQKIISHYEPNDKRAVIESVSTQSDTHREDYHNNRNKQKREQTFDFDYEMEAKLMRQKSKAIDEASRSILTAHSILQETMMLTHEQGQHVEIISDSIFSTLQSTKQANRNLEEANEYQKKAKGKYVFLSIFIVFVVAAALLFIFL